MMLAWLGMEWVISVRPGERDEYKTKTWISWWHFSPKETAQSGAPPVDDRHPELTIPSAMSLQTVDNKIISIGIGALETVLFPCTLTPPSCQEEVYVCKVKYKNKPN